MLQGIYETFNNTINYGGLISLGSIIGGLFSDIIWPLLWRVLMILAIGIVIYLSIHIIINIRDEKKKKKAEQKYIDELKVKYGKYSKQELTEIYNIFVKYIDRNKRAQEARKMEAFAASMDEDQRLSLLVTQMAAAIPLWDVLPKKYQISVDEKYLHYDMAYLKRLI